MGGGSARLAHGSNTSPGAGVASGAAVEAIWLTTAARLAAGVALALAVTVVLGWLFGWAIVCTPAAGLPSMKLESAIGLLLLGAASLASSGYEEPPRALRSLWRIFAVAAAGIGMTALVDAGSGVDLRFATHWLADPVTLARIGDPGHMSVATATALLAMGASLATWRRTRAALPLAIVAGSIGAIDLVLYVVNAAILRESPFFSTMAVHTASALLLLAAASCMLARRDRQMQRPIDAAALHAQWLDTRPMIVAQTATLILGLALTAFAMHRASVQINGDARAHFDRLTERLVTEARRRINLPLYGVSGIRGLFVLGDDVRRTQFRAYTASRDVSEFPGTLGFGFIERVPRAKLDAFVARERADGAPSFEVRSAGAATDLFVVKFIEPLDRNRAALGYDVGSEPARRAAAERAIRTGEPTLTAPVALLQDARRRPGFLFMLPIYRSGSDPKTPEERSEALLGLAYAPILIDEVFAGMTEATDGELDVEVFDGTELTARNLVLDLAGEPATALGELDRGMFHDLVRMRVGGREWSMVMSTTPAFEAKIDRSPIVLLGLGGMVLTATLAGLLWSLGRSRARARAIAQERTADLVLAKTRTEDMARELEARSIEIQTERDRLELALSGAGLGSWEWNPQTGASLYDARYHAILGEEALEPTIDACTSRVHPDDLPNMLAAIGEWLASGSPVCERTFRVRRKDGAWRCVNSRGIVVERDADGRAMRVVGTVVDVTDRQQAEEAIRSANEMLERTGAMAHVGGWELDVATQQPLWSDEVYRIHEVEKGTKVSLEEAIGFYAPEAREEIAEAVQCAIDRREGWDLELPLITARGRTIRVRARGEAIVRDGVVVKLVGAFQDVTEQYEARQELAHRAAEMERLRDAADTANRAKSAFLANMSHEIRTPLTAILGYADLLREDGELGKAPASRLHTIETIVGAGRHLLAVINDILDLSKIEADKMTIETVETSLAQLLVEVESLMRQRAASRSVALSLALATPVPDRVMTDPTRLRQILMNLVGNAVKFTQEGSVTVRAGVEGAGPTEMLAIVVEDTGPGMTAAQVDGLFVAFSQSDCTVTRQHGGTGLGLTISRRLARLMGGDVTLAWTEPGRGSRFRVLLPLVPAAGAAEISSLRVDSGATSLAAAPSAPAPIVGRILLAEDSPVNQRLISLHLTKAGAEVDVAANGRIALEMLDAAAEEGHPYDLLLTDMQMPEMDGYSLARLLRARGSTLPIVAVTAFSMAEDRQRCIEAGCNDYVSKPIDKESLRDVCRNWIRRG